MVPKMPELGNLEKAQNNDKVQSNRVIISATNEDGIMIPNVDCESNSESRKVSYENNRTRKLDSNHLVPFIDDCFSSSSSIDCSSPLFDDSKSLSFLLEGVGSDHFSDQSDSHTTYSEASSGHYNKTKPENHFSRSLNTSPDKTSNPTKCDNDAKYDGVKDSNENISFGERRESLNPCGEILMRRSMGPPEVRSESPLLKRSVKCPSDKLHSNRSSNTYSDDFEKRGFTVATNNALNHEYENVRISPKSEPSRRRNHRKKISDSSLSSESDMSQEYGVKKTSTDSIDSKRKFFENFAEKMSKDEYNRKISNNSSNKEYSKAHYNEFKVPLAELDDFSDSKSGSYDTLGSHIDDEFTTNFETQVSESSVNRIDEADTSDDNECSAISDDPVPNNYPIDTKDYEEEVTNTNLPSIDNAEDSNQIEVEFEHAAEIETHTQCDEAESPSENEVANCLPLKTQTHDEDKTPSESVDPNFPPLTTESHEEDETDAKDLENEVPTISTSSSFTRKLSCVAEDPLEDDDGPDSEDGLMLNPAVGSTTILTMIVVYPHQNTCRNMYILTINPFDL